MSVTEFFPGEFSVDAGLCRQFVSAGERTVFEASGRESARAYGVWCIDIQMATSKATIPADAAHARMCKWIDRKSLPVRLLERNTMPPHKIAAMWLKGFLATLRRGPRFRQTLRHDFF